MGRIIRTIQTCLMVILTGVLFTYCGSGETSVSEELLPIYSCREIRVAPDNRWQFEVYADHYIHTDSTLGLKENLESVLVVVSDKFFKGLKISLIGIDHTGKHRIAKVDLQEPRSFEQEGSSGSYDCWYDYFQGTSGGTYTQITLLANILQESYKGPWIDGVQFYYQGAIFEGLGHFEVEDVSWRWGADF